MDDYISKRIKYFNTSESLKSNQRTKDVFHYTSPEGIFSILKNQKIQFTDCQFVNDKSEYNHITEVLKKVYDNISNELVNDFLYRGIVDDIEKNYEHNSFSFCKSIESLDGEMEKLKITKKRYYIFCTTKISDSLSMWNYYVKNDKHEGYNLQLGINKLLTCLSKIDNPDIDIYYGDVIYDNNIKMKELEIIIKDLDQKYSDEVKKITLENDIIILKLNIVQQLFDYTASFRLFYKDDSFKEEKEYRFVIRMPMSFTNYNNDILKSDYTVKKGIIVPYCELDISNKEVISAITLSPLFEKELAQNGLERLLASLNIYKGVQINQSRIPIRY